MIKKVAAVGGVSKDREQKTTDRRPQGKNKKENKNFQDFLDKELLK